MQIRTGTALPWSGALNMQVEAGSASDRLSTRRLRRTITEHKQGVCHEACDMQMHTGDVMLTTATHQRRLPI